MVCLIQFKTNCIFTDNIAKTILIMKSPFLLAYAHSKYLYSMLPIFFCLCFYFGNLIGGKAKAGNYLFFCFQFFFFFYVHNFDMDLSLSSLYECGRPLFWSIPVCPRVVWPFPKISIRLYNYPPNSFSVDYVSTKVRSTILRLLFFLSQYFCNLKESVPTNGCF